MGGPYSLTIVISPESRLHKKTTTKKAATIASSSSSFSLFFFWFNDYRLRHRSTTPALYILCLCTHIHILQAAAGPEQRDIELANAQNVIGRHFFTTWPSLLGRKREGLFKQRGEEKKIQFHFKNKNKQTRSWLCTMRTASSL